MRMTKWPQPTMWLPCASGNLACVSQLIRCNRAGERNIFVCFVDELCSFYQAVPLRFFIVLLDSSVQVVWQTQDAWIIWWLLKSTVTWTRTHGTSITIYLRKTEKSEYGAMLMLNMFLNILRRLGIRFGQPNLIGQCFELFYFGGLVNYRQLVLS